MRVHSAFLIALLFRQPEHPRIADVAAEVARQLADESALEVPLNFRLNAASILFNYYNWKTKGDTADALIARVTPWLADPRATPLNRVWWRVHLAFNHQIHGRYAGSAQDDGRSRSDRPRARAALGAVRDLLRGGRADRVFARRCRRRLPRSNKLRTVLNPSRRMDVAYFKFQESTVRMLERRAEDAVRAAQRSGGRSAATPGCRRCRSRTSSSARRCRICSAMRSTRRSRATTTRSPSRSAWTPTTFASSAGSSKRIARAGKAAPATPWRCCASCCPHAASGAISDSCASCPS